MNYTAFGKNDIRGKVGISVTPELCELVGKGFAKYITDKTSDSCEKLSVSVARDARSHSPELTESLIKGLLDSGINVVDLGLMPTPMGYFSEYDELGVAGAMIVTASHNPPEYNGIKMTFNRASLSESEIAELKEIVINRDFISSESRGEYTERNIVPDYIEKVGTEFTGLGKGIKVVVDSGNATGGVVAPELYRKMGCEVIDIFSEPDGNFPNHHPDPSKEQNLVLLKQKVLETGADFGIAFDGDSDRIGVVDNTGYSLPGDQLLLLFALDILENRADKPAFISEVKCSQILFDEINRKGGNAIMWKTGHAYIKTKMKEENAILAGEMSGHIFFKDRYWGYDDAVYAGCRIIEIAAKHRSAKPDFKFSDLIDAIPKTYTSREVRHACPDEFKVPVIEALAEIIEKDPSVFGSKIENIITLDGLRLVFDGGFALIRASNTEPTFTLRFEGKTQESSDRYKETMVRLIDEQMSLLREKANEKAAV